MVLSTHGSGRARCERAEQGAWAGAQSLQETELQYVVRFLIVAGLYSVTVLIVGIYWCLLLLFMKERDF